MSGLWDVTYMHDDCPACENCAEEAVTYAKVSGSDGIVTVRGTEQHTFGRSPHSASVRRAG